MASTHALIMAAGGGDRFGGGEAKQYIHLHGRPMLVWAIERFSNCPQIDSITIVVEETEAERADDMIERFELRKVRAPVVGGSTRQESVSLGLMSIAEDAERVLVHDAARPCVTMNLIKTVVAALDRHRAVIPALPAVDTLIREHEQHLDAILDRVGIAGAQTPQGFHTDLLVKAHRRAESRGFSANDDGSLVFALGEAVATIAGERANIKVTYEDDMRIAEAILELQKQGL